MRVVWVSALTVLAAVAAGCGGGSNATPPSPSQRNATGPSVGSGLLYGTYNGHRYLLGHFPKPFDPRSPLSLLGHVALPNVRPSPDPGRGALPTVSTHARGRQPSSVVTVSDWAGQYGIGLASGQNMGSFTTDHMYHSPNDFFLTDPGNAVDSNGNPQANVLYAPTSKGTDTECYENGSDYWVYHNANSTPPATRGYFRVYDFCASPTAFVYSTPMDSNFEASYVFLVTDSLGVQRPFYSTEAMYSSATGQWRALLYNQATGQWDDLGIGNSGSPGRTDGWSIFETHYFALGACPNLPEFRSANYSWTDMNGSGYSITDYYAARTSTSAAYNNQCLQDDGSHQGYVYSAAWGNDTATGPYWQVTSSPSF